MVYAQGLDWLWGNLGFKFVSRAPYALFHLAGYQGSGMSRGYQGDNPVDIVMRVCQIMTMSKLSYDQCGLE